LANLLPSHFFKFGKRK